MAFFDNIAESYDETFSHSGIGSRLRQLSWRMIENEMVDNGLDVLEINCGTGEDALYFASEGHIVTATDASSRMIDIANRKNHSVNPCFEVVDFNDLSSRFQEESFDIILSNFGGLNCVDASALQRILNDVHSMLKPGGKFIAVIMGSACIWETAYFLLRRDKKAFRRMGRYGAETNLHGQKFVTFYHSPRLVKKLSKKLFQSTRIAPLGFFIPPTYLEPHFAKRPFALNLLAKLEVKITSLSILSNLADHYMIVLKKRA